MSLALDLLRHGAALAAAEGGDAARDLSPRGERDLEGLALHLANLGWRPDRAFTSPLKRARDSARIVLRHAAPDLVPDVVDALLPEGSPAEVIEMLMDRGATAGRVLLVSHQPLLGGMIRWLTSREAPRIAPGDLVGVEFAGEMAPGSGILDWKVHPPRTPDDSG